MGNIFSIFFGKTNPALEQGEDAVAAKDQQTAVESTKQDEVAVEVKDQQVIPENEKLDDSPGDDKGTESNLVEEIQFVTREEVVIEKAEEKPTICMIEKTSNEPPEEFVTREEGVIEVAEEKPTICMIEKASNEPPEKLDMNAGQPVCFAEKPQDEEPPQPEQVVEPSEVELISLPTPPEILPVNQSLNEKQEKDIEANDIAVSLVKGAEELKGYMSQDILAEETENEPKQVTEPMPQIPSIPLTLSEEKNSEVKEEIHENISETVDQTILEPVAKEERGTDTEEVTTESIRGAEDLKNFISTESIDNVKSTVNQDSGENIVSDVETEEQIKETDSDDGKKSFAQEEVNQSDIVSGDSNEFTENSNGIAQAIANVVVESALTATPQEENTVPKVDGIELIGEIKEADNMNANIKDITGASDLKTLLENAS